MPIKALFKMRGWLALSPVLLAMFCYRGEVENDTIIWGIGGALFLAGMGLRVWAQCHVRYRLRVPKEVASSGPYRYTRNPIYIANTAMVAALVWLLELPWLAAMSVVWCAVVYSGVVRYEERRLLMNFGEVYRRYCARVPRWLGRGWTKGAEQGEFRRFLKPALVAEAHCLLFLLAPVMKEWLGG